MDMIVIYAAVVLFLSVHQAWTQASLNTFTTTITQTSGYAAVLTCQVRNLGNHKVIWLGPSGTPLTIGRARITSDARFSVETPYAIDWNLHIRHVKPSDAGEYICKVATIPPQVKRVILVVKVAPKINHELSTKDPYNVQEGQNVTLTCVVTAEPQASLMWFFIHQSNPDKKDQLNQYPQTTYGDTVTIHEISRSQAGVYECIAFNGVPPTSGKNITVNVEFPPTVITTVDSISQYRGKNTILECNVKVFPAEVIVWKKGNKEFVTGHMDWKYIPTLFKRSESEYSLTLQLFILEPSDFGLYTCEASNPHGKASASVYLKELANVKPSTTTTSTTTTVTTTIDTSSMSSTTTRVNTTLSFPQTTQSKLTTTTTKNGDIIIDEGDGDREPHYSVISTPTVKTISPAEQDPRDSGINAKWSIWSISLLFIPLIL